MYENIVGQRIVGFELKDPRSLHLKLHDIVQMLENQFYPNEIFIHQVIKASEEEYVVILHERKNG